MFNINTCFLGRSRDISSLYYGSVGIEGMS